VASGQRSVTQHPAPDAAPHAASPSWRIRMRRSPSRVKRVPRGYPADHPRAGLVKYRSLIAAREFEPDAVRDVEPVYRACDRLRPLLGWLSENAVVTQEGTKVAACAGCRDTRPLSGSGLVHKSALANGELAGQRPAQPINAESRPLVGRQVQPIRAGNDGSYGLGRA
jgi:hypothetical protein